jgi:hypothetical protein
MGRSRAANYGNWINLILFVARDPPGRECSLSYFPAVRTVASAPDRVGIPRMFLAEAERLSKNAMRNLSLSKPSLGFGCNE